MASASTKDKISVIRSRLDSGRQRAENMFDVLRESEAAIPKTAELSRDEQMAAMLSRIRVNLPGVVYGEATEGVSLSGGLPQRLSAAAHIA